MATPRLRDTVRFVDAYNGVNYVGILVGVNSASHFDHPVWDAQILSRNGESLEHMDRPLILSVTQEEITDIIHHPQNEA